MEANAFVKTLKDKLDIDFFTGVPDSLLRPFCDALMASENGVSDSHIIAADEGGAVGLAAGHYLATGKPSVVYMQNSGIGNAVNPICSLINDKVYAIPMLFVVGWRGEPGVHDEPQHIFQGEISDELLQLLDLDVMILDAETSESELTDFLDKTSKRFDLGKSSALLVRKGALKNESKADYKSGNTNPVSRERAVELIVESAPQDAAFVSTTGKLSRELFELREARNEGHGADFLTVGSMGHSSMIALSVALAQPDQFTFVLDGDGAVLMHTGAMGIVASRNPKHFIHVLVNNAAHETVGGMPTVSPVVDYCALAQAFGYAAAIKATSEEEISAAIKEALTVEGPVLVEVMTNIGSRADLGRPTTTAYENGKAFMEYLKERK